MKNKSSALLLVTALFGITITAASAHPGPYWGSHHGYYHGYYGPAFVPSFSFVIAPGSEERHPVSFVGHIYRQVGDDTYLFTDGNTTYQLDSDDSMPIGARIVVGGHLTGDGEISVGRWSYLQ